MILVASCSFSYLSGAWSDQEVVSKWRFVSTNKNGWIATPVVDSVDFSRKKKKEEKRWIQASVPTNTV